MLRARVRPTAYASQMRLDLQETEGERFVEVTNCHPGDTLQVYLRDVGGREVGPVVVDVPPSGVAQIPIGTIPAQAGWNLRVSSTASGEWVALAL